MPKRKIILLCLLFFSLLLFSFYFFIYPWWEKKKLEEERNIVLFLERVLGRKGEKKCYGRDQYYFFPEILKGYPSFKDGFVFRIVPSLSFCNVKFSSEEEKKETIEKIRDYVINHGFNWAEIKEEGKLRLDAGEEIFIRKTKIGKKEKDELFTILASKNGFFYLDLSNIFLSKEIMKEIERKYLKKYFTCYTKLWGGVIKLTVKQVYRQRRKDKDIFWLNLEGSCGELYHPLMYSSIIAKIENGKYKEVLTVPTTGFLCADLYKKNIPLELMEEEYCWDDKIKKAIKYEKYYHQMQKSK